MDTSREIGDVDLGFAEEQEFWLLTNRYFPSKVGGKVAWLELENIPESREINCDYCSEPCIFLCQIYAGSEKNAHAFHRSIYVFICRNGKCCTLNQSGNIKVLRSQLPLKNKFYPDTPPDESIESEAIEPECKLCNVCSCKGPMVCGKCKKVNYCGQLHQKIDWKYHKKACGQNEVTKSSCEILFPEYEIVIEREEKQSTDKSRESEKEAESRRLREYEDMMKKGKVTDMNDISEQDLQEFAESKEDKAFGKFKKAIEGYSTQIIRYHRHGEPLWIASSHILSKSNIPKCQNCSGKRTFEFQIMPQMLNELKNYELDWGIIAVYTCENDCNTNGKYIHEFCYKQDITKSDEDNVDVNMEHMDKMHISENSSKEIDSNKIVDKSKQNTASSSKNRKKNGNDNKNDSSKKAFKECDNWE